MPFASKDMTNPQSAVNWIEELGNPVPYPDALNRMESLAAAIREGNSAETIWLLQHPPLYTAGTSARRENLLDPDRFPVFETGRGGEFTYHGPGQIVGYAMLDLKNRSEDVRAYVHDLESWLIATLAKFGVRGERREGRVGIWVVTGKSVDGVAREKKIAAIGVRIRRWVAYHGVSLNVEPDLSHFDGIVPCGISDYGVTSLVDLGITATLDEVAHALRGAFEDTFGRETCLNTYSSPS